MPCQTRRLGTPSARCLVDNCEGQGPYIGKTLAAAVVFATVRFFAGVGPNVHRQGTTLNEAFDATGMTAMVRPFVGMDSIVTLEIRFPIETLLRGKGGSAQPIPWPWEPLGPSQAGRVILSDSLWARYS